MTTTTNRRASVKLRCAPLESSDTHSHTQTTSTHTHTHPHATHTTRTRTQLARTHSLRHESSTASSVAFVARWSAVPRRSHLASAAQGRRQSHDGRRHTRMHASRICVPPCSCPSHPAHRRFAVPSLSFLLRLSFPWLLADARCTPRRWRVGLPRRCTRVPRFRDTRARRQQCA